MKKILYSMITVSFVGLALLLFIYYSEEVYRDIYSGKYPVTVSFRDDQNSAEFLEDVCSVADETDTKLFYSAVLNATSLRSQFEVYTNSMDRDFIDVPNNCSSERIAPGECISTENNGDHKAYAGNVSYDFAFYDLSCAGPFQTKNVIFYVEKNCDDFLKLLEEKGYPCFVSEEENTEIFDSKMAIFLIIPIFIFLIALHYAYSRNREIVILKLNGYRNADVFRAVFMKGFNYIWSSSAMVLLLLCVVYAAKYGKTALYFAKWSIPYIAGYTLLVLFAYSAACILYTVSVRQIEIRASKPKKILQLITMGVRFVAIISVIWGISFSYFSVDNYLTCRRCKKNASFISDAICVTLNTKGSPFTAETEDRSYEFMRLAADKYPTCIIDSGDAELYNELYVSENYFEIAPCILSSGKYFSYDDIEVHEDVVNILVPDTMTYEAEQDHEHPHDDEPENNIIYYKSGQMFPVADPFCTENYGNVKDPVIYIYNSDLLYESALHVLSSQYFFIFMDSDDPLGELEPIIEASGLSDMIHEAITVDQVFDEVLADSGSYVIYYTILGIFYLALLIIITMLENTIYFENHSRELCIKFLHGYSFAACKGMWIIKIISYLIILTIAYISGLVMTFAIFAAALDILLFAASIDELKTTGMIKHLKGET